MYMRLSLLAVAASTLSICSTAFAKSSVYIISEKDSANHIQPSDNNIPETTFSSFSILLSHILGTSERHHFNIQDAQRTFHAVNKVLSSSPALDRSNLFSNLKGSMFVSVGGVHDNGAILPTYNPALFVKDDRSSDFADLLSDHNEYHIQLSGLREDGVTRFYDGEELYVTDDMDMFERFKVTYPEINVDIFDISKKADQTFVAEVSQVHNTVKDFAIARANSVKRKADLLTVHMTSLEGLLISYGPNSEQYKVAQAVLKDLFAKTLIPDFEQAYDNNEYALSTFVLSPTVKSHFQKRAPPSATPSLAPGGTCYEDISTCEDATDKCSGRGSCGAVVGTQCYACTCNSTQFVGEACEIQDISSDFQLLFWTTIALLVILSGALTALYKLGSNTEAPPIIQVPTKQE
ncbi:hypothetical protein VKS41_005170 [Umbelopsis sp. WA50703]